MFLMRYLLPILIAAASFSTIQIYADDQGTEHSRELRERDFEAIRDFLKQKNRIDLEKKASNLKISGDIRFEWQHITETLDDKRLRGPGAPRIRGLPVSRNDFDVEFNLKFGYEYKNAWAAAHLNFDNAAGIGENDHSCLDDPEGCFGSGDKNRLNLKRAYMGYNFYECGDVRFDVEIGRRKFFDLFDSIIQFDSRFDGIVLEYTADKTSVGDWYWYLGGFVVDERVNHFGYVTETGLLNILDSGAYVKYSFIDWELYRRNRCDEEHPRGWQFKNSQVTVGCYFHPFFMGKKREIEVYGAFLVNHAARRREETNFKKKNIGWYVGIDIGKVQKEGDWAFQVVYEVVQAQAVSDCDVAGIGRGNLRSDSFTSLALDNRGNANFKGIDLEFFYAITDNLTIDTSAKFSTAEDSNIGKSHRYCVFEVESIYAF